MVGGEIRVVSATPNLDGFSPIADEAIAHFRAESGIGPPGPGAHDRFSENAATMNNGLTSPRTPCCCSTVQNGPNRNKYNIPLTEN